MKIIGNFGELMRIAKALGDAKKRGNAEEIQKAQAEHDSYRDICIAADEVSLGLTYGQLTTVMHGASH